MAADSRDVRAGGAFVEIGVRDRVRAGLARIQGQLRSLSGFVGGLSNKFALLGAGLAASLGAAAKHFADVGSEIFDMSKRTGASAEFLSEVGFALEQSGGSAADLEKALRQSTALIDQAAQGSESARKKLEGLGLSVEELASLNAEERFTKVADAISAIGDETRRTGALIELFGARSGTKLAELLEGGLAAARAGTRRAGGTITSRDAELADELGDALGDAQKAIQSVVLAIGGGLAPVLADLLQPLRDNAAAVAAWIRENKVVVLLAGAAVPALFGLSLALKAVGVAFAATATVIGVVSAAVTLLTSLVGVLSAPLLALVGIAATLAVSAVDLGAAFRGLGATFAVAWQGIKDAVASGDLQTALAIAGKGLEAIFSRIVTTLKVLWFSFLQEILVRTEAAVNFLREAVGKGPIKDSPTLAASRAKVTAEISGRQEAERLDRELRDMIGRAKAVRDLALIARRGAGFEAGFAIADMIARAVPRFNLAQQATAAAAAAADQQARGGFTQQATGAFAFGNVVKAQLDVEKEQLKVLKQIEGKVGEARFDD